MNSPLDDMVLALALALVPLNIQMEKEGLEGKSSVATAKKIRDTIKDHITTFLSKPESGYVHFEELQSRLGKMKGGYVYSGACSYQVCFPLKAGGELRFSVVDDDCANGQPYQIDLYDGALPPCITGFAKPTGDEEPNDQQTDP